MKTETLPAAESTREFDSQCSTILEFIRFQGSRDPEGIEITQQ
jgi:hypothetical protein